MNIIENYPLKRYNTFGIDVKAKAFAEISRIEDLREIYSAEETRALRKIIIGGGSNILFKEDVDALLIKNSIPGINISAEDEDTINLEAGAGVIWNDLVNYCVEHNYGGIENLALIPGTAGAAPMQNIGAYGQEIKDVFVSLRGIDTSSQEEKLFGKDECEFGYRDSIFKRKLREKFVITHVTLKLSKIPVVNTGYSVLKSEIERLGIKNPGIKDISRIVSGIRISKLPNPEIIGNAGSFFKNPVINDDQFEKLKEKFPDIVGYPSESGGMKIAAGWLIESCGWKGKRYGNAGVHEKQALVLVNYGSAGGKEILELAGKIKESVYQKFGITLHEEINIY